MKKIYLLFIMTGLFAAIGYSQPGGGPRDDRREQKREQIQAQKIAFIADKIDLTPEEAQEFWPVYNSYESEVDAVRKKRRKYMRELRKNEELTEERSYELFELIFKSEKEESDIRLKYLKKFSEILGKEKGVKVFIAEEEFKRVLLKKLKKDGPPPPPEDGRP